MSVDTKPKESILASECDVLMLKPLAETIMTAISQFPDKLEIQTSSGKVSIDTKRTQFYSGGEAHGSIDKGKTTKAANRLESTISNSKGVVMMNATYYEPYTSVTEKKPVDNKASLEVTSTDRKVILKSVGDQIKVQPGVNFDDLARLAEFFAKAFAEHKENERAKAEAEKRRIKDEAEKTHELIEKLL